MIASIDHFDLVFMCLKSRRNPLIVFMNNSKNWVFASGQVWGLMTNVMKTNMRNIFRITNVTEWKTKVTWKTLFFQ